MTGTGKGKAPGDFPVTGQDVVLDKGDTIQCPAEVGWKRASVDPEKFRIWLAEFWSEESKRTELPNMEVYGGVWDEEIIEQL